MDSTDYENINEILMLDKAAEARQHETPPEVHENLPSEAASLHLRYSKPPQSAEPASLRLALCYTPFGPIYYLQ